MDHDINPFAPPPTTEPSLAASNSSDDRRTNWVLRGMLWTVVCCISAGPSFLFGSSTIGKNQLPAMALGVFVFIVAYTIADVLTASQAWRRDRRTRLTLKIGYITRMLMSVIFPLGGMVDLFCGLISVQAVRLVLPFPADFPDAAGFFQTLVITLVQGIVLNVLLAGYMVIVHGIQILIFRRISGQAHPTLDKRRAENA